MAQEAHRADVAWGVVAQFLQYGAALLLLPLMVTRLSQVEIGLWFVFVSIQSMVSILDFGFSPTISRNFAYVAAGAREIRPEGVPGTSGGVDARLFAALVRATRLLYACISALAFLLISGPGTWYIARTARADPSLGGHWTAWALFGMAVSLSIYSSWYAPLLSGSGHVAASYRVSIVNRAGFALLAALALVVGMGFTGVAAAYLVASMVSLVYATAASRSLRLRAFTIATSWLEVATTLGAIRATSVRAGVASLSAFLISRFSVLVVSSSWGLETGGSYAVSLQVFSSIYSVSLVAMFTFLPRIAAARIAKDWPEARRLFVYASLVAWLCFIALGGGAVLAGNALLMLIHSRTMLLSTGTLALLCVVWLLEANHALCATVITTGNTVPFAPAAVLSGLGVGALTLAVAWAGWDILAVVAVQGLVQAVYNNWKWPVMVWREFGVSWSDFREALHGLVTRQPKVSAGERPR